MDYLLTGTQMQQADRFTIEHTDVTALELMERAAQSCIQVMEEERISLDAPCIVCGSGNNGGDGFAIARLLAEKGYSPTVCMVGNRKHCTRETEFQMAALDQTGIPVRDGYVPGNYSTVIDAVFGVGLNREIQGDYREVLRQMNDSSGLKVAIDIPSGISADTGMVMGIAFLADITITFQKKKTGLFLSPGRSYTGKIFVTDIGISTSQLCADGIFLPDLCDYQKMLPARPEDANKGDFGKLLVIAGSKGMSGAAYLNAMAAYLSGAGLIKIYTAEENRQILQSAVPEAILCTYREFDRQDLTELLQWADTVCIGSGLGTSMTSLEILRTTLESGKGPFVIDADGLNLLSAHPESFRCLSGKTAVLTPHMKEMSRLLNTTVEDLKEHRISLLKSFVKEHAVVCVLKDARTLTGVPDQGLFFNRSGNCAMAKAGAGDVLAGIIAGLMAQHQTPRNAACLGVYLHGRSGDLAREAKGVYSVLARDLLEYISFAFMEISGEKPQERKEWL